MELPDVGEHCALDTCNQLDFLPFTCDACKKIYCNEHVKYDSHNCVAGLNKDRRVPVCPLCNQPISLLASESPDQKVNDHIENDCKSDLAKHKRSSKCGVKGCKKRELIPVLCTSCKRNFCLRHRHESDHDCQAHTHRTNQSSASSQAGLAATTRYSSSAGKKPTSSARPANRKPQQSNLSSIGSDLNRVRNERRQVPNRSAAPPPPNMRSMQGVNVTEDEALALAMQASLADSNFNPQDHVKTETATAAADESADLALARAIAESEKEERERQRRINQQSNEKNKDSCVLS